MGDDHVDFNDDVGGDVGDRVVADGEQDDVDVVDRKRSAPEQNAEPAPVTTTTRTEEGAAIVRSRRGGRRC